MRWEEKIFPNALDQLTGFSAALMSVVCPSATALPVRVNSRLAFGLSAEWCKCISGLLAECSTVCP